MEVFKNETSEILRRFMGGRLNFPQCIAALDAALSGLISTSKDKQTEELRAVMLANNETVMTEMERRRRPTLVGKTTNSKSQAAGR